MSNLQISRDGIGEGRDAEAVSGFGRLTTPFDVQANYTVSPDRNEASILLTDFSVRLENTSPTVLRTFAFSMETSRPSSPLQLIAQLRGGAIADEGVQLRVLLQLAGKAELLDVSPDEENALFIQSEREFPPHGRLDCLLVLIGDRLPGAALDGNGLLSVDSIDLAAEPVPKGQSAK